MADNKYKQKELFVLANAVYNFNFNVFKRLTITAGSLLSAAAVSPGYKSRKQNELVNGGFIAPQGSNYFVVLKDFDVSVSGGAALVLATHPALVERRQQYVNPRTTKRFESRGVDVM